MRESMEIYAAKCICRNGLVSSPNGRISHNQLGLQQQMLCPAFLLLRDQGKGQICSFLSLFLGRLIDGAERDLKIR